MPRMGTVLKEYLIYFVTGGVVTTIIVALENSNARLVSGFATLVPVFTLIAYFFIGEARGGVAVSQHAWLVLIGTLVAWVPYMIIVALLSPKIGSQKAILSGLALFAVLAFVYLLIVNKYGWFRGN